MMLYNKKGKGIRVREGRESGEQVSSENRSADYLQEEIEMLREMIRQSYQTIREIEDPAERLRGLNSIGAAISRVATLLKTQQQLNGEAGSEIARAIDYAIQEAARRLKVEL